MMSWGVGDRGNIAASFCLPKLRGTFALMPPSIRVAIDIGGTFTDIVVMSDDGTLHESKVSTTPDDPSRAVVVGLSALLAEIGLAPATVAGVVHGTNVGTNRIEISTC